MMSSQSLGFQGLEGFGSLNQRPSSTVIVQDAVLAGTEKPGFREKPVLEETGVSEALAGRGFFGLPLLREGPTV
jgi:hypothetical protein